MWRFDQLAELRENYDIRFTQVNTELTAAADIIVLCVKPQFRFAARRNCRLAA